MTWQSLAAVLDDATTREADDAARLAPIRTLSRNRGTHECPAPGCELRFSPAGLNAHFRQAHSGGEDRACPDCEYEGTNRGFGAHRWQKHGIR